MKVIIFDSSTIINFTMNGLLDVLRELKNSFPGKFIIPRSIKYETIDRPLNIKKFELGALNIQRLLDEKTLELPEAVQVSDEEIKIKTREILKEANHIFLAHNEFMHIIDEGEAACLALSKILSEKGIKNVIAVDERTTRMLGEMPENLHKLFEKKFHTKIKMSREDISDLKGIKFIRSSELVYVAWKKGLVKLKDGKVLDALLYATKFKGSAISREEIEEMKRL
ncbi:MAG: hypothetical protein ABH840_02370 [Nanoarchaeota archaeon]